MTTASQTTTSQKPRRQRIYRPAPWWFVTLCQALVVGSWIAAFWWALK